eukprot:5033947-Prymnesium_polylepis.2
MSSAASTMSRRRVGHARTRPLPQRLESSGARCWLWRATTTRGSDDASALLRGRPHADMAGRRKPSLSRSRSVWLWGWCKHRKSDSGRSIQAL